MNTDTQGNTPSHTPEPWHNQKTQVTGDGVLIAGFIGREANANRIVACVNACKGMADPASEIERLKEDSRLLHLLLAATVEIGEAMKPHIGRKDPEVEALLDKVKQVKQQTSEIAELREAVRLLAEDVCQSAKDAGVVTCWDAWVVRYDIQNQTFSKAMSDAWAKVQRKAVGDE